MARFVRRLLDFETMQRATLTSSLTRASHYLELMAQPPPIVEKKQAKYEPFGANAAPPPPI
jgi:hypothetical protein